MSNNAYDVQLITVGYYLYCTKSGSGLGSVVSIATGYRLDGPRGSNPVGGRDFPHLSRPVLGPTQPPGQ